jgi:hypothetical protein
MVAIGIDPGTTTGLAIKYFFQGQPYMELDSGTITHMMMRVHHIALKNDDVMLFIEDARKRNWFGARAKEKLQGAGSIKRDCAIWEDWAKEMELPYHMIAPKDVATKQSSEAFALLTGIKRSNQHERDAAMIVWGISLTMFKGYLDAIH